MNKQQYSEYLKSDYWNNFSKEAKDLYGNKCWFCESRGILNTHHLRYYKTTFFSNRLVKNNLRWFVVLCQDCHVNVHSFISSNNLETRFGTKLYAKIFHPGKRLQMTKKQLRKNFKTISSDQTY